MKTYGFIFVVFTIITLSFFYPILHGLLPIPSDTIIGLYHPFRDLYARDYPNGIVFKNFLLTDPVRQQYPYRNLAISEVKDGNFPLWNPYSFSGTPLLASMQSAPLYPLNLIFLILPFSFAWSFLVVLQPLLAGYFLYMYLRNVKLSIFASLFSSVSFVFSGFFIAWLEWGTILHVALWLPLLFLAIDKIFINKKVLPNKDIVFWGIVFILSLSFSLLAGHLQTFFYSFVISIAYIFFRWFGNGKNVKILLFFLFSLMVFLIVTFVQWLPTLQFILQSARDVDQSDWMKPGWFIPWQNLIQFLAPDFFGNPATLNYWGVWNYGEFIGYIGLLPLLFAGFAFSIKKQKTIWFFFAVLLASLLFSLPNPISSLPYIFHIPFLSTAQPTRLLFLVDFSLAVLTGFGLDQFIKDKKINFFIIGLFSLCFIGLWVVIFTSSHLFLTISFENIQVAKRNLIFPTILFGISLGILFFWKFLDRKKTLLLFKTFMILFVLFDLFRFGMKFIPFTSQTYLFPSTRTTDFLQKNLGSNRFMSVDSRILPPSFSVIYKLQSIEGYDPLYLQRYGELIAASERKKPDIAPPFGFNRIITPHNYDSKIIDLLGVKYILSFSDISSSKLKKVFQEGETRIYENKHVFPRAFFVRDTIVSRTKKESINLLFDPQKDLDKTAIVELGNDAILGDFAWKQWIVNKGQKTQWSLGNASIQYYTENNIIITTENKGNGFLVLTDIDYQTWRVTIDGKSSEIIPTDYTFRGVVVPWGKHTIMFYNSFL